MNEVQSIALNAAFKRAAEEGGLCWLCRYGCKHEDSEELMLCEECTDEEPCACRMCDGLVNFEVPDEFIK